MRNGRKTPAKLFAGFNHASASATETPVLTALTISPGCDHECKPERVLGDTAYGGGPVREQLAQRGVEMLAPVAETSPKGVPIPKSDFAVDLEAGTVTCRRATSPACTVPTRRASASRASRRRPAGPVRSSSAARRAPVAAGRFGSPHKRSYDNVGPTRCENRAPPTIYARRACASSACSAWSSTANGPAPSLTPSGQGIEAPEAPLTPSPASAEPTRSARRRRPGGQPSCTP